MSEHTQATYYGDFGELVVATAMIDVTSINPRPDHGWRYTDRQGHEHYWQAGYPTLRDVIDDTYWCDDCADEHAESHMECALCGETVKPGLTGPSMVREVVPGRTTYWLNGASVSEERARQVCREMGR